MNSNLKFIRKLKNCHNQKELNNRVKKIVLKPGNQ